MHMRIIQDGLMSVRVLFHVSKTWLKLCAYTHININGLMYRPCACAQDMYMPLFQLNSSHNAHMRICGTSYGVAYSVLKCEA